MRNSSEAEAAIQAGIAADPDSAEWTREDVAHARPAAEVIPAALYAELTRHRGRQKSPTKEQVAIRLDRDLLERLRASGDGWQSRANAILRKAVGL